jgi:hypothetical protein
LSFFLEYISGKKESQRIKSYKIVILGAKGVAKNVGICYAKRKFAQGEEI